jgi:hypothetical protein
MTIISKMTSPFTVSIVAAVSLFALNSVYDRSYLFQKHKMAVSVESALRSVIEKNQLKTTPDQLMQENPASCRVYPFIRGVIPPLRDNRSITSVMFDRLASLFWLEDYSVQVSIKAEGRVIHASVVTNAAGKVTDYFGGALVSLLIRPI